MIETVTTENFDELLPLIREYQEFYQAQNSSDEKNRAFFSRFGEGSPLGCQFVYREDGQVVGFASVYFTFSTVIAEKVGVLNDLYTQPRYREQGIGRKLIEHCRRYALSQGAIRLQWLTAAHNEAAQHLYDSLETKKSAWYFYAYEGDS